jgi:hypothetical protein
MLEGRMPHPDERSGKSHQHRIGAIEERQHMAQVCRHMADRAGLMVDIALCHEFEGMDAGMADLHQQDQAGDKPT